MPLSSKFDTSTPFHARSPEEIWYPYASSEERVMRDAVCGSNRLIYERSLNTRADYISRKKFFEVYNSSRFAQYVGNPLNGALTVDWELAGVTLPTDVDAQITGLLGRFQKFMDHRGHRAKHWVVVENGPKGGYHSHAAMHVPEPLKEEFKEWLDGTLLGANGKRMPRNLYKVRIRKPHEFYSQWRWFRYCMKGLDPALDSYEWNIYQSHEMTAHKIYGLQNRWGGPLEIKRVRISRSLGPDMQKRAGYFITPKQCLQVGPLYDGAEYQRGRSKAASAGLWGAETFNWL